MALIDQLLAYYKLDESSGNALDSTANAKTLTNTGTAGYSAGKINNAVDFGASNTTKNLNRLETGALGLLMDSNFTVNFWLNLTTQVTTTGNQTVICWSDDTTANKKGYFEFQLYDNAGTPATAINRVDSAGADQVTGNLTFTVGTWYMVTLTWDGSNMKSYRDGSGSAWLTVASTRTGTNTAAGHNTRVAIGELDVTTRAISGLIDEMGWWNRVLSAAEITELYNGGAGLQYPFGTSGPIIKLSTLLGVGK